MPAPIPIPEPHDYGTNFFDHQARFRARDWLWQNLNDEQRQEYVETRAFVVKGNDTGARYKISYDKVVRLAPNSATFCLVLNCRRDDTPPYEDWLLAKKILIECAEDLFLRIAHLHGQFPERR